MARRAQSADPPVVAPRQAGVMAGKSEAVVVPIIAELIRFNSSRLPPGWFDQRHLHPFHQIDVVLEGRLEHDFDRRRGLRSRTGDAVLIPPLTWHRTHSRGGCWDAAMKVYLSPAAAAAVGTVPLKFRLPAAMRQTLVRTSKAFREGWPFYIDWAVTAGTMVVLEAIAAAEPPRFRPPDAGEFRGRLMAILSEAARDSRTAWSVQELADRCSMSADHFTRSFTRELGLTPREFILESRMRLAATMLTGHPARSVKQAAELTGYTTVQAFSRAFRQAFDISPAEFQRRPSDAHGPSMNRRKA